MEDQGAFLSVLKAAGRPGQAVKNVLAGRPGSAARQLAQLGLDAVDSILPGDWLPNDVASEEDDISGKDLIGAGDGILGNVAGFGVDVLTDPLTYVPGAAVAKGLGAAGKVARTGAAKVLGEEALNAAGRHVRSTFGVVPESARNIIDPAKSAGALESQASMAAIKNSALGKLAPGEDQVVADLMDNLNWQNGKVVGPLKADSKSVLDRITAHPGVTPENQERITNAVNDISEIGRNQRDRAGIFTKPPPDPTVFWDMKEQRLVRMADENPKGLTDEYLGRKWTGQTEEQKINEALGRGPSQVGTPNATQELTLDTPEKIADFMAKNPKAEFSRSAIERMADRAQAQGTLATRAEIGKKLVGDGFEYANPEWRKAATDSIRKMAETDPEGAKVVMDAFSGIPPRGGLASLLAKSNSVFKPAATVGYILPKLSFNIRNRLSGIWQTYSNPETRAATGGMAKRFFSDTIGAIADGLGISAKDELGAAAAQWENALGQSGGSAEKALSLMQQANPQAADFIKAGGLDGFVRSEDLIKELNTGGLLSKLHQKAKWPAKIGKGIEDRMRLGLGLDLIKQGKSPEEAAKLVKDTLFRYDTTSAANRTFKDLVPFGSYSAQAIPQQAKLLAEKPWLASSISHLVDSDGSEPVMPYMEGRINLPLGDNQYISGLGLPFEVLNSIPNPSASVKDFGRQLEKNVVGAAQPLAKTAFSAIAGNDPFFDTAYGSYKKVPIAGDIGEAGALYNELAGTGAIQALDSPLRQIDHLLDDRKPAGYRALDALSGLNFVTVDPDKARQAKLQDLLANNPDVLMTQTPINVGGDPEVQALINELRNVKASLRKKKHAGG